MRIKVKDEVYEYKLVPREYTAVLVKKASDPRKFDDDEAAFTILNLPVPPQGSEERKEIRKILREKISNLNDPEEFFRNSNDFS